MPEALRTAGDRQGPPPICDRTRWRPLETSFGQRRLDSMSASQFVLPPFDGVGASATRGAVDVSEVARVPANSGQKTQPGRTIHCFIQRPDSQLSIRSPQMSLDGVLGDTECCRNLLTASARRAGSQDGTFACRQ